MVPEAWRLWKDARLAALAAPDGWLNLTDRLEIAPGRQRVGRGPDNDLVLSAGPEHLGVLRLTDAGAEFTTPDGVTRAFAATDGFPQLAVLPLLLELHTVDDRPALRVRDMAAKPQIALDYFTYDPSWRILARWEPLAEAERRAIGQKGAGETTVTLTHRALFTRDGVDHALLPTHWKAGKPMFVIRDATSGRETYAASRFLIGEVTGDQVLLDFNCAHSPPCAFTDFAVCPLPPPENRFAMPIRAGELFR
jgi:hypothetical protein